MNNEALKQAVDALQINSVSLFAANCWMSDQYLPAYEPATENLQAQFKYLISKTEKFALADEEEGSTLNLIRFHADFGARLVLLSDGNEPDQKVLIEATFVAEYEVINEGLSEESITEFALRNVMFNVWPYWREYLTSTGDRMNLPKIKVPFFKKAQNAPV